MSPERLNSDQRLLYDALREIWDRDTARIMATCCVMASLVIGIAVGVLYGARTALTQATGVVRELETRASADRSLVLRMTQEQQRSALERALLSRSILKLRADLARNQYRQVVKDDHQSGGKKR